ncbi:MAG: hypothetical protein H6742_21615 [Alphaproteobacteria bacterium]|nr:hypothetical protein [Alphaproteobacteria bacterium]
MGVGRVVLGAGKAAAQVLPGVARKALSDRFFYAVFNVTRVTNDHYGWRPDAPAGRPGEDPAPSGEDRDAPDGRAR